MSDDKMLKHFVVTKGLLPEKTDHKRDKFLMYRKIKVI